MAQSQAALIDDRQPPGENGGADVGADAAPKPPLVPDIVPVSPTPPPAAAAPAQASPAATNESPAGQQARQSPMAQAAHEAAALMGQVVWLMSQSAAHRHVFVTDLDWLVTPAMMSRQMQLWKKDGTPVAYASWASVSAAVEERLAQGQLKLAPSEWRSGDLIWLIDLIAPFGGAETVLKELRAGAFADKRVKTLARDEQGKLMVRELVGVKIEEASRKE